MKKSLTTLIKIRRRELDNLRRQQAQLETTKEEHIRNIERLNDSLFAEQEAAELLGEMRSFFGDFSDAIKKKQHEIARIVLTIEKRIQELSIEINNAFAELKKYEIAQEQFMEREAKERALKEQKEMDAIGERQHYYGDIV